MTTAFAPPSLSTTLDLQPQAPNGAEPPRERLAVDLRLVRRKAGASAPSWNAGLSAGRSAQVILSRDFSCALLTHNGDPLTHSELGNSGLSIRTAWDLAASHLLSRHSFSEGTEFLVRDAGVRFSHSTLSGVEVSFKHAPATAWLAHPVTFSVLHQHFQKLLRPTQGLIYATTNYLDLFVFDAHPHEFSHALGNAAGEIFPIVHSLGFPLSR
ncbi:hypothetical protein [Corynebacterium lubricantis]|uniref:hypothetical protein n=1 Tax=Corynebacterium lubricantis TaxID=541095 RepID=UPI0012EAA2FE|nr:hypothetical protein [Corynebacterium lubricantis]